LIEQVELRKAEAAVTVGEKEQRLRLVIEKECCHQKQVKCKMRAGTIWEAGQACMPGY
jgi:hypothetical protein